MRRTVHQHARAGGGGDVDEVAQQVQRALAPRRVIAHQRQALGFHQQPVQAADGQAVRMRRVAPLARVGGAQRGGAVGQREGRDLQRPVAPTRRGLALRRQRQRAQNLVAQGELHAAALCGRGRRYSAHTRQAMVTKISAATAPAMGRVKKGVRSPSERISARRRFFSSRSPSTMASTSGAMG